MDGFIFRHFFLKQTEKGFEAASGLPQCLLISWAFSREAWQKFSTAHTVENSLVLASSHVFFPQLAANNSWCAASSANVVLHFLPLQSNMGLQQVYWFNIPAFCISDLHAFWSMCSNSCRSWGFRIHEHRDWCHCRRDRQYGRALWKLQWRSQWWPPHSRWRSSGMPHYLGWMSSLGKCLEGAWWWQLVQHSNCWAKPQLSPPWHVHMWNK